LIHNEHPYQLKPFKCYYVASIGREQYMESRKKSSLAISDIFIT
jgi:hypothetical protein